MNLSNYSEAFRFEAPWMRTAEGARALAAELRREVTQGHPLYSMQVRAIARRCDCDDVLFETNSADFNYAVVHLTFGSKPERDTRWPYTELYATFVDWVENRMRPDVDEWVGK